MRRPAAICACFLVALSGIAPRAAERMPTIGFLANTPPATEVPAHPAARLLVEGLRERGWTDGKNMRIVWRSAEGTPERLPALAEELASIPVDVIVAYGPGVLAAAGKTRTVPIVMGAMGTFEGPGTGSLARPAANVTGVTLESGSQLDIKRLELLKEIAPSVSRVAFLDGNRISASPVSQRMLDAARALRVTIVTIDAGPVDTLSDAFQRARREGADGVVVADWPQAHRPEYQAQIHRLAEQHRVPVIHAILSAADTGALMAYGSDILDSYRRAPYFVDRILRGVKPSDLPVEQASRFRLVVNPKAARAIGLAIPPSILVRADRVVE